MLTRNQKQRKAQMRKMGNRTRTYVNPATTTTTTTTTKDRQFFRFFQNIGITAGEAAAALRITPQES